MILSRSYFLILSNRFSDTFFNILGVFSATRNYKWFFNKKKEIDFDEFWSSIKNYFFLIQKKKMKNLGGYFGWKYLLISRIIFYFKNNLLKSRIRIDGIIFYFFVIYLHVTPHLIGRLLRTDDMFPPSSPPVSWRQSVLPYLLEQTFKRWGKNNHAVKITIIC